MIELINNRSVGKMTKLEKIVMDHAYGLRPGQLKECTDFTWATAPIVFADSKDIDNFKDGAIRTGRFRKVKYGD